MKKIVLFLLASVALVSCLPSAPAETISEEVVELKGTKWQLIDKFELDAFIEFDEDLAKLNGSDGCNNFQADIIIKNYQIEFKNFTNTRMYCEELDNFDRDFLVSLSKVRDYTVLKQRLNLHTAGTIEIGDRRANQLTFNRIEQ